MLYVLLQKVPGQALEQTQLTEPPLSVPVSTKAPVASFECALASEAVLAKDWLSPEEDEAWKDL